MSGFLTAVRAIVGAEHVLDAADDKHAYSDHMAFDTEKHAPAAAIVVHSTEEVQAVLRLANQHEASLWPISRGKNLGYGGSAPVQKGAYILDLSRMKRIHEVNVELGYCVVEPGVSFYDLFEQLEQLGHPLWMSVPGYAWGSVMGNALERGAGPQPYGDHAAQICGLEVVLPTGELVRTGTGAMTASQTSHLSKNAYGPGWEPLFCQSNFGVVTKMGLWLMPAPEATMSIHLSLPESGDLARGVRMIRDFRLRRLIDHDVAWINHLGIAPFISPRSRWYEGEGLLPPDVSEGIRQELGLGWWNAQVNLFGHQRVIEAQSEILLEALTPELDAPPPVTRWSQGEPIEASPAGVPRTRDMKMIDWRGVRGGHMGFSPILPSDPDAVMDQAQRTRALFERFGVDYFGAFAVGARSVTNINEILYDRDDPAMERGVDQLFQALIQDAAEHGYSEYRTHISYMDDVADMFDFNNHAMRRLNHRMKDMMDPNGVLAPGKQGIWPARLRSTEQ